jgi:hypothetical protein
MRFVGVGLVSVLLAGCAGGEATRWIGAENKIVQVEGIPYQVQWVRDAAGIDMRGVRVMPIVIMPDEMLERRRNTEAAVMVGAQLCGTKPTVLTEMKSGDSYTTRLRCP